MNIGRSIHWTFACVLIIAALCACTAAPQPAVTATSQPGAELIVFAAASLKDAFTQIANDFQNAHPGAKVALSFGGSNQLRVQIEQGAHADVFASANTGEMNTLVREGLVVSGTNQVFTRNRLTVIIPKDNPAHVQSAKDLARQGLKLVLANDKVPAGQYARQILGKFSADPAYGATFSATVMANVVSNEEDVKQVVQKVQLGEADAGIVYVSDLTPSAAQRISLVAIPDAYNVVATYPIAPLKDAPHAGLAKDFIDAVLAPAGRQTLQKWGFEP